MYLKIRQREKDDNNGKVESWYIIGDVKEVSYKWVKFEKFPHKMYEGCRLILTGSENDLKYVRRLLIFHDIGKMSGDHCEEIYCDDDVYLCNENGKTIEHI